MAGGHHEYDRQQAGYGEGLSQSHRRALTFGGGREPIEVLRHPIRIDDRHESIDEGDEVQRKDRGEDERVEREPEELDLVEPQHDPSHGRDEQDRRRGERERSHGRARVKLSESGKQEGEKGRGEGRPGTRRRALWFVHRG